MATTQPTTAETVPVKLRCSRVVPDPRQPGLYLPQAKGDVVEVEADEAERMVATSIADPVEAEQAGKGKAKSAA